MNIHGMDEHGEDKMGLGIKWFFFFFFVLRGSDVYPSGFIILYNLIIF